MNAGNKAAFTLIELLVVIVIIGILGSLLFPALSRSKAKAAGIACLNNNRQILTGWVMYVEENGDRMPINQAEKEGGAWRSVADSWTGPSNAVLDGGDYAIKQGSIYPYVGSPAVYKCPADRQRIMGNPTSRSFAVSGVCNGQTNENQTVLLKASEAINPSTGFVTVDEYEGSIDDGHFLVWPEPYEQWINIPGGRHNSTATFGFLDGHVEAWKWRTAWPPDPQQPEGMERTELKRLQRALLKKED